MKRLILAGGGHAHLAVLEEWIRHPPTNVETVLVTPQACAVYSGMLPGWMAGHYRDGDFLIDLELLCKNAGVSLVLDHVCGLDANGQSLRLAGGDVLDFDVLSLAVGGQIAQDQFRDLGEKFVPIRPVEKFVQTWPRILAQAAKADQFELAVLGGGAGGVELAFAAQFALARINPAARVHLIAGGAGLVAGHHQQLSKRVETALCQKGIAIHHARAKAANGKLVLGDGTFLAPDWAIGATGSVAPGWLARSGLALGPGGFAQIGPRLRSASHFAIFAAGDISARSDRDVPRSGVHAVKSGPILAANLKSALGGKATMQSYNPRKHTLYLLATGPRHAILSWGGVSLAGHWVWRLKNWIDRGFVRRYARLCTLAGGRDA